MADDETVSAGLVNILNDVVNGTKKAATEAATAIDDDAYTAGAALKTAAGLASTMLNGGIRLAELALGNRDQMKMALTADDLLEAARGVVEDTRAVADELSQRLDDDDLTKGSLLRSATDMAHKTARRGLELSESAVDRQSNKGAAALVDHLIDTAREMVGQAALVVDDVGQQLDDGTYGADDWVKSAVRLGDIAMLGGLEMAETAFVGPARLAEDPIVVDPDCCPLNLADDDTERVLQIHSEFTRVGGPETVPNKRIRFRPSEQLSPGGRDFQIEVRRAGLPSGLYTGQVNVCRIEADASVCVEQTLTITIGL